MAGRLENKIAIITGGATGIGEAICHKFALEGASVVIVGLPSDPVDDVVKSIVAHGHKAIAFKGDVADERDAAAAVTTAIDAFGRVDVLVNNAGVFLANALTEDYPIEDFDRTLRNNLRTAFLMTRFALPHLQKSVGNIIYTGSEAGFNGEAQNTPYGGSKGFLHAFMMGVAVEQARHGIRANCVCPGPIDTAWTHKETGPMDKQMETLTVASVPLGRRGTPEEMANVFAFLASDEASFVTGAMWLADGGVTPCKGNLGEMAGKAAKTPPSGPIAQRLQHSHDGLRNKETHQRV